MKQTLTFLLLAFVSIGLNACKKDSLTNCEEHLIADCEVNPSMTNIRITNVSDYDYCNVVLNTGLGKVNYGILKQGETSCYKPFLEAYRYAYVQLFIGDDELIHQPIDYFGEELLGQGKFTYSISVLGLSRYGLSISVSED